MRRGYNSRTMHKRLSIILTTLMLCLYSTISLAVTPQAASPTNINQNIVFCPATNSLKKDLQTKTWNAQQGQWKSYEISFVDAPAQFLGAQWAGANVGQITCIYRGKDRKTFPILLIYHTIAYAPFGGRWSPNLGGYANCKSEQQQDCPFRIRLQSNDEDINQQLEKMAPPSIDSSNS